MLTGIVLDRVIDRLMNSKRERRYETPLWFDLITLFPALKAMVSFLEAKRN